MSRLPHFLNEHYCRKFATVLKELKDELKINNSLELEIFLRGKRLGYASEIAAALMDGNHPIVFRKTTEKGDNGYAETLHWNTKYEPTPETAQRVLYDVYENKLGRRKKYNINKALKEYLPGKEIDAYNDIIYRIRGMNYSNSSFHLSILKTMNESIKRMEYLSVKLDDLGDMNNSNSSSHLSILMIMNESIKRMEYLSVKLDHFIRNIGSSPELIFDKSHKVKVFSFLKRFKLLIYKIN